jgi:gamma-glutamyltranspeptidase / glutathione hydrolase
MPISLEDAFHPRAYPESGFPRQPGVLGGAMIATSHPLATRAGVSALDAGGNAVDAALTAAAVLTVAEPCECGPGGDGFAQVWFDGELYAINGSGRSPRHPRHPAPAVSGPLSVTVPGVVAMWADLNDRWGRLGLDRCLRPAVALAEEGVAVTNRIARLWRDAARAGRAPFAAPRVGERYRLPDLGRTLAMIARDGPAAIYEGECAAAIADASWLSLDDLAGHRSAWVEPLRLTMGSVEVCELPPNSQGVAALQALAIARDLPPAGTAGRLHVLIEAMKLALADARRYVGDAPVPPWLLDDSRIADYRALIHDDRSRPPDAQPAGAGGTSYLCVVDEQRNAVSLIQSLFHHFGSGVTPAGTGITLQNRAAGFAEPAAGFAGPAAGFAGPAAGFAGPGDGQNAFAPGKRPYHTLMPGMLLEHGKLLGPFGVMGGAMQAQGHLQVLTRLLGERANPQSALDAARFRVEPDGSVLLEPGLWPMADPLRRAGHAITCADEPAPFGVGQIILSQDGVLVGGSDGRGDGMIGGY